MQKTNINTKIIYSFRIKNLLALKGFNPILETDNPKFKGYKCWVYEASPAFEQAFVEVAGKEE